jgi:heme O synthase-like polyprenyltransferase
MGQYIVGLQFTEYTDLVSFIFGLLNLTVSIAALVAVIFLVYAGFRYILAAGDEKKIEEATKTIIYSLIGLVICFIAPLVVRFLVSNVLQTT